MKNAKVLPQRVDPKFQQRKLTLVSLIIISFLVLACGSGGSSSSSSGAGLWSRTAITADSDSGLYSVHTDKNGNIYAVGWVSNGEEYDFGNGVKVAGSHADENAFIIKYSPSGKALWARASSGDSAAFEDVATDSNGNVYAVGNKYGNLSTVFSDTVSAGACVNAPCALVVKFNSAGVPQWARINTTGADSARFHTVAVDADNNIYAGGRREGDSEYRFSDAVAVSGGVDGTNALLVKINPAGDFQWAGIDLGAGIYGNINDLAVKPNGDLYAATQQSKTLEYGVLVRINKSDGTAQTSSYNSRRNMDEDNTQDNYADNAYTKIAADAGNNIYLAVRQHGTRPVIYRAEEEGQSEISVQCAYATGGGETAGDNAVLLKYDNGGNVAWAIAIPAGDVKTRITGLTAAADGSVYVTWLSSESPEIHHLSKYSSAGALQWSKTAAAQMSFHGIALSAGGVIVAGNTHQDIEPADPGNGVTVSAPNSYGSVLVSRFRTDYPVIID